jgi:hypothetical protein
LPYIQVVKNKYKDDYKKFKLLIPIIFVKIPRIMTASVVQWSEFLASYRSGGPVSIPGTTKTKVVGLERGPLSFVCTTEEPLDRKEAAPV